MEQYRLFFSWQNDRKDTRSIINSALNKVKKELEKDDIDLYLDQDTRERTGKRNIDAEVLEKIRRCDIFVADLTPVITYYPPKESHNLPKHLPNSNVMYEYGYALHAKGENRMIILASLNKEEDEHIEYMPFDINHDTITLFTDADSLKGLSGWIRNIIKDVDKEREAKVPQYACSLLFNKEDGFGYAEEITIRPRYKRVWYTNAAQTVVESNEDKRPTIVEALSSSIKMQELVKAKYQISTPQIKWAKVSGDTINHSFVPISLFFINQGSDALDNLKIWISASDERVTFDDSNVKKSMAMIRAYSVNDTSIGDKFISQHVQTLNPHDSVIFDTVYIHAPHDIGAFHLHWTLSSRTLQDEGILTIHVEPEFEYDTIENDNLAGTEKVIDYIIEK